MEPNSITQSIAHAFVYGRIKQKIKGNITDRKKILEILRFIIRIPGPHQEDFLKEMERVGMIKRLSRDKYEIIFVKNVKLVRDFYGNPLWS